MLKKIKKPILKDKRFCHVGKRVYFCTRFRSKKLAINITNNVQKQ